MIELNDLCRQQQPAKGFIAMDGFGLTTCLFVDFGPEFVVHDSNGDPAKTALIENITQVNINKLLL
jgi:ubiquitin-activating enzyme E1